MPTHTMHSSYLSQVNSPFVRNKANFGPPGRHGPVDGAKQSQLRRRDTTGKCLVEKELWRIEHAGGVGETKPISEGVSSRRSQRSGLQALCTGDACVAPTLELHTVAEPPGRLCETKPILPWGGRHGSGMRHRMPAAPRQRVRQGKVLQRAG